MNELVNCLVADPSLQVRLKTDGDQLWIIMEGGDKELRANVPVRQVQNMGPLVVQSTLVGIVQKWKEGQGE